jgi:hypothetical protein
MRLAIGVGVAATALAAGLAVPVYAAVTHSQRAALAASSARARAAAPAAKAAAGQPAAQSAAPAAAAPAAAHSSGPGAAGHATRPAAAAQPRVPAIPAAGNPDGHAFVPPAGRAVSTAHPAHVVGHGTPASCTSRALVRAVAQGGVITFSCGPAPVTITMTATAKVRNTSRRVVIDGGGKITLSGGGKRRILYQDTCDPHQVWTTSHCQDQASPQLIVQNITFAGGNSTGQKFEGGGGGAIFDRGGRLKVVNSRFVGNRCDRTGPDLGGAAIRALSQYHGQPVYIVNDTFRRGVCSNGGALSSIGVSWDVLNSVMFNNRAIGFGANPASHGTPGGGSGAAIYTDGDLYTVTVNGCIISRNSAKEGGGAIFYVSNDHTGTLHIAHSRLHDNPNAGFFTAGYPGIFYLGQGTHPIVTDSTIN